MTATESASFSGKPQGLSVVILAKNEERHIAGCLESCTFADEIIVVDDESTDKTAEIARAHGAKIYTRSLNGDWGSQQNFAVGKASFRWVFILDCDERITPELKKSIEECIQKGEKKAYKIQRENHFHHFTATHGTLRPDWVLRLLPNEGIRVVGQVHQKITTPFPEEKISGFLIHWPYRDWDHYYGKLNNYCRSSAVKYAEEKKSISFFRDVVFRPFWAAFKVFFFNRGFLDGKMGFIFAANHYSYTLQKYVRYYTESKFGKEL
jgi:glycosyltransferase involved in cell wall biosynthesis